MRPAETALFAADSIYLNGKVVTVDADDSVVERPGGQGRPASWRWAPTPRSGSWPGLSTEVVDLAGKTVLPGINDSHMHAALTGGTRPPLTLDCRLSRRSSRSPTSRTAIRARVAALKPGEWIRGAGWNEGYLDECLADRSRHITRWDLDEVAPDNPVYLVLVHPARTGGQQQGAGDRRHRP